MHHGTMGAVFHRVCRFSCIAAMMLGAVARAEAQQPAPQSVPASAPLPAPAPKSNPPPKPAPAPSFEPTPPHEFRLKNGLRFVVQRDTRQPIFAFLVSYEVGSRDDPPGYEGLAHLVEHLTFRGSRHLGPHQGDRELQRVGALRKNGVTRPGDTVYFAVLPSQYLPLAFWVESERMGFTLERFNDESLALELATVRKELLQRNRHDEVDIALYSRLFPEGSPYRVTEQPDARAASLSDVKWFFQAGYRPDRATVVIVGDVDPSLVEALAHRYFGPIRNPPVSLLREPIPVRDFPGRERLTISRLVRERRLIMVWPAPPPGSKSELTLHVALEVLRNGRFSVGRALRKGGFAEGARTRLERRDRASFVIVEPLNLRMQYDATEYAIEKHMWELSEEPPSGNALNVARNAVKRAFLRDTEDPLDFAFLHLDALRHRGRPFELRATLAGLDAVTSANVADLVRRYFSPYRRFSTWYGDLRHEPTVPYGDYIQYEVFH